MISVLPQFLVYSTLHVRINTSTFEEQADHRIDQHHYDDVIMGTVASQITSLTSVYSTVYSGADQSKHQSSASLAFVWGIHRGPVNSPHKWPVTRKMFPFDDVIMIYRSTFSLRLEEIILQFAWSELFSQLRMVSMRSLYNILLIYLFPLTIGVVLVFPGGKRDSMFYFCTK